jgi:transcriptional regulator with XRE-family HTH domain
MKKSTELGKRLRLLRVTRDENIDTMASRLGITGAYLCNLESSGIMPAELVKRLIGAYALPDDQKQELINVVSDAVLKRFWEKA